jgi:hypothetical protein
VDTEGYPVGWVLAPEEEREAACGDRPPPFFSSASADTSETTGSTVLSSGFSGLAGVLEVEFVSNAVSFFSLRTTFPHDGKSRTRSSM